MGFGNFVFRSAPQASRGNYRACAFGKVLETVVYVRKMELVLYAIESYKQIYEATKMAESRLG